VTRRFTSTVTLLLALAPGLAASERWWPHQALPATLLRTIPADQFPQPDNAYQMMVQSAAGLAARAVNEGKGDELVWVESRHADLGDWLARWQSHHPAVKASEPLGAWELIEHLAARKLIQGYILYRTDRSVGEHNAYRPAIDVSVNVATSLCGLLDGVLISEELRNEAEKRGLKLLLDVRDKTQSWCFQAYREKFNRRLVCTQDPRKPHVRDLAIAQRAFTCFGEKEPIQSVMQWLEPLSPILGWNGGDEFQSTDLSTRFGHIQTATDWCMNLPVLMAGSHDRPAQEPRPFRPSIDWSNQQSAVSFVLSDGDNVQWLQGNFFRHPSYWATPERGRYPFGWSSCFAQLLQLCPSAMDFAFATRSTNDSFIEWGGGYYYPDHFGANRSNRWELLTRQAQRTWALMKRSGTRIIGFNVARHDSPDALRAYQVFAQQTDSLLGILVFQYHPYEGGAGKTFWVKDQNGVEIPVVTARYSIWENIDDRERCGTPAKIAREMREAAAASSSGELVAPRYDWAIVHAWSYFRKAPGTNESAENLPPGAGGQGGQRGYIPFTWCAERLPKEIRTVSPEELLWRIRSQRVARGK
jgi:hypothetical protein